MHKEISDEELDLMALEIIAEARYLKREAKELGIIK